MTGSGDRGSTASGHPRFPPTPTLEKVLERLGVAGEPRRRQQEAATDAAYGGRLSLAELRLLRQANLIPYNKDEDG
jgi:hypothetical protein